MASAWGGGWGGAWGGAWSGNWYGAQPAAEAGNVIFPSGVAADAPIVAFALHHSPTDKQRLAGVKRRPRVALLSVKERERQNEIAIALLLASY